MRLLKAKGLLKGGVLTVDTEIYLWWTIVEGRSGSRLMSSGTEVEATITVQAKYDPSNPGTKFKLTKVKGLKVENPDEDDE